MLDGYTWYPISSTRNQVRATYQFICHWYIIQYLILYTRYQVYSTWYCCVLVYTIVPTADIYRPSSEYAHLTSAAERHSHCAAALAFAYRVVTRSVCKRSRDKGALFAERAGVAPDPGATTSGTSGMGAAPAPKKDRRRGDGCPPGAPSLTPGHQRRYLY